jgi:transcriptional regulator with XRE-family HTH domain
MAIPPPGRFDADLLRRTRLAAGLSRAQLAKRIGADPTIVKAWETKGVRPTVNNLTRVAEALDLAVGDLYEADDTSHGSLADLRVAAGLNQRELAQRVGVSQTSISKWERAKTRPSWDEISRYAQVLGVVPTAIADAVDTTAAHYGDVTLSRNILQSNHFRLTQSSPHVIYDFDDPHGYATVSSPQFPRLAFQTKSETPTMLELATLNEHVGADYLHRYNHLQHRCQTDSPDDAVYLIRWLSPFHDTPTAPEHSRSRTAAELVNTTPLWRSGVAPGPTHPLSTGEYLVVVVTPGDTVGFLFDQLSHTEPVTFYPTRSDDTLVPLAIDLNQENTAAGEWPGCFDFDAIPRDMTYSQLVQHLPAHDTSITAAPKPDSPPHRTHHIHQRFSEPTPYDGRPHSAAIASPQ